MPEIVAYKERESADPETGEPGILRKEWRVRKVKDFAPEELDAAFGPDWRRYRPFAEYVLEMRYIRRGVEEPWTPHSAANTFEQALESVDSGAIPVHPKAKKLEEEREEYRREEAAKAEEKRLAEIEAEERRRKKERSEATFRKMSESPKFAPWATRWNDFIAKHRGDKDYLESAQANEGFMRAYNAVVEAQTVPAKAKAIRVFLEAFGEVE